MMEDNSWIIVNWNELKSKLEKLAVKEIESSMAIDVYQLNILLASFDNEISATNMNDINKKKILSIKKGGVTASCHIKFNQEDGRWQLIITRYKLSSSTKIIHKDFRADYVNVEYHDNHSNLFFFDRDLDSMINY